KKTTTKSTNGIEEIISNNEIKKDIQESKSNDDDFHTPPPNPHNEAVMITSQKPILGEHSIQYLVRFDLTLNKVGFKVASNKENIFIEVSGGPENVVTKHVREDTEKLIKEAMFDLVSLFRTILDKNAENARNICIYMVQCIGNVSVSFEQYQSYSDYFMLGDRITLSELRLDKKHFYKISQIKSAMLPFSFERS
ncbi:9463_t:CDS:2, partial [Entrophospora sp. SA101]